ncbi:hypothetical protein ACLB2K_053655 [Fragaria x ananassa]
MGNEYNRFNHHHQHYHHHHHHHVQAHLHINHRGTFLPMLCSRPSIKDVQVPSVSFSTDSVSPRISCMGQVKRSNKVSGYPITTQATNSSTNIKYSKLKKLFSGKNLTPRATPTKTTTATATAATATSCPISRSRRPQVSNVRQGHCVATTINLAELDPPLPVIKRVQRSPQQGEESLYKRRSGGAALKGLQLKQVHLPRLQTQSTSV